MSVSKDIPVYSVMEVFKTIPRSSWGSSQGLIEAIYRCSRVDAIIRAELYRRNLPIGYFDDAKSQIILILIDASEGNWLSRLDKAENFYTLLSGIAFRFISDLAISSHRFSLSIDTGESESDDSISLDVLHEIRGQEPSAGPAIQFDSERAAVPKGAMSFIEKMKKNGFPADIPSTGSSYKRVGRPKLSVE